ncbi:MAG TPA: hypothetical protein VEH27_11935 [Methylomirabilota bacterium]|nr:hypothetical protein [Methylomirabilota bacterium]
MSETANHLAPITSAELPTQIEDVAVELPSNTVRRQRLTDLALVGQATEKADANAIVVGRQTVLNEILMEGVVQLRDIIQICGDPETKAQMIESQAKLASVIAAGDKRILEASEKMAKQKKPGNRAVSARPGVSVNVSINPAQPAQAAKEATITV